MSTAPSHSQPETANSRVAPDVDPQETTEWVEALDSVVEFSGRERARYVMARIIERARRRDCVPDGPLVTDFVNSIPADVEHGVRLALTRRGILAVAADVTD